MTSQHDSSVTCPRCGSPMKMLLTGPPSEPNSRATFHCTKDGCPNASSSQSSGDPNEGSLVLFKRYGTSPDAQRWALGRVVDTFFVDTDGRVTEPTFDGPVLTPWVTISPDKPEGPSAPTTLTVPLDVDHVDPIIHGSECG